MKMIRHRDEDITIDAGNSASYYFARRAAVLKSRNKCLFCAFASNCYVSIHRFSSREDK